VSTTGRDKDATNNQWGQTTVAGGTDAPADITPAIAGGKGMPPLVDLYGRPWVRLSGGVAPGGINAADSVVRVASSNLQAEVIIGAPAKLYFVSVWGIVAVTRYLQIFDRVAIPAGGEKPEYSIPIALLAGNRPTLLDLKDLGDFFATGITAAVSSVAGAYDNTGVGNNFGWTFLYKS
jgi:hypothetical protein